MEVMIYGNGESRKQFDKLRFMGNYTTWGCNAIYRDMKVDNLVSVDYAMQQEIESSGYTRENVCYFTDWSVIPNADDMLLKTMKMDFEPHMIKWLGIDECIPYRLTLLLIVVKLWPSQSKIATNWCLSLLLVMS